MIVLRNITYESHCEHHMAPIIGKVHVGYLPNGKVVGISKLARVVESYARRFQIQEKMTAQIAACIQDTLTPRGVGVVIEGAHAWYDYPRYTQAWCINGHLKDARHLPRRRTHPRRVLTVHRSRYQRDGLMNDCGHIGSYRSLRYQAL